MSRKSVSTFRAISLIVLAIVVLTGLGAQSPSSDNPSERGEPTRSDKAHPEQPAKDKPADGVTVRPGTVQGHEAVRTSWFGDATLAWIAIPIAAIVLAVIFSRLSTSPSRDPSREPKTNT